MIEQYLKPMTERAYGDAAYSNVERNAATLAKWIVKTKAERINTREIQRAGGLLGLHKALEVKEAIKILVEGGWLRADPKRIGGTAGKRSDDYNVNPTVISGEFAT